uniref:Uncharacterized protein n=1 Tax=Plectus sambesii TaxID=2011161 RepID=A0A914XL33_9BILA
MLATLTLLLYISQSTSIADFAKLFNDSTVNTTKPANRSVVSTTQLTTTQLSTTQLSTTRFVSQCSLIKEFRLNVSSHQNTKTYNIGILVIVDNHNTDKDYKIATDSLICYARLQNYTMEHVYIDENADLIKMCPHKDKMLRRHCVAAHYIKKHDWTLFVDADIGVINPNHRIEEYIDDTVPLIFYDRFYNWEVAAGSYLAKNSEYASYFLNEWANFEYRLPNSFHGTDNGLLHMILIEQLAPFAVIERGICQRWLNNSKSYDDLFVFQACTRMVLGANRHWPGKLKLLGKGKAWSRDGWITGTKYCAHDFLFHGWKLSKLGGEWHMPFANPDDLAKCDKGFATFTTKPGVLASVDEIEDIMCRKYVDVERNLFQNVGRLGQKF